MARDSIQQFSRTPSENTDINGINVNTGWSPANVGPAFRQQMAYLAWSLIPLPKDITGRTNVTLTDAEASAQYIIFFGTIAADCTVTTPNEFFFGFALNATAGGHSVILTSGAGSHATLVNGANVWAYTKDNTQNTTLLGTFQGTAPRVWTNPSRSIGVHYTNNTTHEIEVNISAVSVGGVTNAILSVNNVTVGFATLNSVGLAVFFSASVPPGGDYILAFTGGAITVWAELS